MVGGKGVGGEWGERKGALPPVAGPDLLFEKLCCLIFTFFEKVHAIWEFRF